MNAAADRYREASGPERAGRRGAARRGRRRPLPARVHRPSRRRHAGRCASASAALLSAERERYSLEVSSPGSERPLTKPAHFRRFVGRRARVRTRHPRAAGQLPGSGRRRRTRPARPGAELHRRARGRLRGARSRWPPTGASSRSPTRRSAVRTWSRSRRRHVTRNPRGDARAGAREGDRAREADGRARGRPAVGLQEAARLGQVRARGDGSRDGRLQGHRADHPRAPGGASDRRDDRRGNDDRPRDRRDARTGGTGNRPEEVRRIPRPDRRARRHARRLRADRRADRQAGDPAAHPRGRAGHDVRGVPRPRGRADHRHRAAVGLPLHARAAARTRRGAAAQVRAGGGRALRPLPADQGRHQGGLAVDQRSGDHRLPARSRADQEAVRARGARRSPTASWRSPTWPASPATARRSRSSPTPTASTRSAPASARAARACAWSSPSCAARRSTSSPSTTSPRASSPRRCRRRACARCSSTTTPSRRP